MLLLSEFDRSVAELAPDVNPNQWSVSAGVEKTLVRFSNGATVG
jgi:hypothetical protein